MYLLRQDLRSTPRFDFYSDVYTIRLHECGRVSSLRPAASARVHTWLVLEREHLETVS